MHLWYSIFPHLSRLSCYDLPHVQNSELVPPCCLRHAIAEPTNSLALSGRGINTRFEIPDKILLAICLASPQNGKTLSSTLFNLAFTRHNKLALALESILNTTDLGFCFAISIEMCQLLRTYLFFSYDFVILNFFCIRSLSVKQIGVKNIPS